MRNHYAAMKADEEVVEKKNDKKKLPMSK